MEGQQTRKRRDAVSLINVAFAIYLKTLDFSRTKICGNKKNVDVNIRQKVDKIMNNCINFCATGCDGCDGKFGSYQSWWFLKTIIFALSLIGLQHCSRASVIAVGNLQSCFNNGTAVSEQVFHT